jgi:EKC/KEOPS complex subunit PCC1/LAGE3
MLRRTVEIPLTSNRHADIVKKVIEVDPELQSHAVKRELTVKDTILVAFVKTTKPIFAFRKLIHRRTFTTQTIRLARLTINSFLENVDLVVRTLGEYGDEADALAES